jgi:hypothetical protein
MQVAENMVRCPQRQSEYPTLSATSEVIDFPSLDFMVSALVAAVRGCERIRRTYGHVRLSQKSLFTRLLG